jgi:hypothetical protein
MSDFKFQISEPGVAVSGAKASQITFDANNPFIKIDTQNTAGFDTIELIITNDPPEPSGGATDAYTVLYKFKHGYAYTPSVETLFYVTSPPPGTHFTQTYFQDFGQIAGQTFGDGAFLYARADKTYVYIVCDKYNAGIGSPNLLSGTNIQITTHVFVEDVGQA